MNKSTIPFLMDLWSSKEYRHIVNKNPSTCFRKHLEHMEEQGVFHVFNKIKAVEQFIPNLLMENRKIIFMIVLPLTPQCYSHLLHKYFEIEKNRGIL